MPALQTHAAGFLFVGPPGLARRLPSRDISAWGRRPTSSWAGAVPCLCVCGAHCWSGVGLVPFCAPPPPLVLLCSSRLLWRVWRVVPAGFPLYLLAGMPFRVVRAFPGLGPVVLSVRALCPLCIGALSCVALALVLPWLPPPLFAMCALREVLSQSAGRAVSRVSRPLAFPTLVPELFAKFQTLVLSRLLEGFLKTDTRPLPPCRDVPELRHSPSSALLSGARS